MTAVDRPSRARPRSNKGASTMRPLRAAFNPTAVPGRRTVEFSVLLVLTLALTFIGLIMVLSASAVVGLNDSGTPWHYLQRQGMWAILGVVGMGLMMRIDYRFVARLAPLVMLITGGLLVLVLFPTIGVAANGARRWLTFGPLTVQPSEIAKVAIGLYAADLLTRRASLVHDNRAVLAPIMLFALLFAGLVLAQPSQGSATIIVAIAMLLLFIGGVSIWTLGSISLTLGFAFVAFALSSDYRRERIGAWGDPFADPQGAGYQTVQSLVGIANGGLDGTGLGAGRSKWGFLPFAHTDFIFTVIAEELGFIGGLLLLLFYVFLVIFGLRVAMRAPDRLGSLLAAGITTAITMQAFINIGAATALLPISGVTLPFVSMGGSSLLVNMLAMGVVLNVARQVRSAQPRQKQRAR